MIGGFTFNGLGAVFVYNLLAWGAQIALALVFFGLIYGFIYALIGIFRI